MRQAPSVSVSGLLSGGAKLLTPAGALIEARRIILAEREARDHRLEAQ